MRASVRTTIIRDLNGYGVRDYGNPQPDPKRTLANPAPSGVHIIGMSGINEMVSISTADNLRLWKRAHKLNSPDDVAAFMGRWGQISRSLLDDGSRPYDEPYLLIEEHLRGIRYLAEFVESGDKEGFCLSLKGNRLLDRANIAVDIEEPESPLIIEAPSLGRFMIIEMWNEFGGERPATLGLQNCEYCGRQFHVGGRRKTAGRRVDARFCSDSCRNMASRARKKLK